MNPGRISITFQPDYGKNMSHLSRKLGEIEEIIHEAHGSDFMIDPNNTIGFLFLLPAGISPQDAERIVNRLGTLKDDDGKLLLDVGQGARGDFRPVAQTVRPHIG